MKLKNMANIRDGLHYAINQGKANNLLILFQTPNMSTGQILSNRILPPDLSVGRKLLNMFHPINMQVAKKVIRSNLFSYLAEYLAEQSAKHFANQPENKSGGLLSDIAVKSFYHIPISQKKKDSVPAVLVQLQSLEQVTNCLDYIGLVQYCQSSAGGWNFRSGRNTYRPQHHRLMNDIHLVQPFSLTPNLSSSLRQVALTHAVDCGRLTLEGEALYQSVLKVSHEMAELAGGAEDETD